VDLWGEDINTELHENIPKRGIEIYFHGTAENIRDVKVFAILGPFIADRVQNSPSVQPPEPPEE